MGFPDRATVEAVSAYLGHRIGPGQGGTMLGSGIIDIAIGLAFVFGVTAALSSVFTELIARFLGLRGAYLLSGLRELLDGTGGQTPGTGSQTALKDSIKNYEAMKDLMQPPVRAAAGRAKPVAPAAAPAAAAPAAVAQAAAAAPAAAAPAATAPAAAAEEDTAPDEPATRSATGALLGSPILRSQGMVGEISTRDLTLQPGKAGRPAQMTAATGKWSQWRTRRSLPAYISAESISEAVIDLLVPNSAGDTTMTEIQKGIKALPNWMPTFKDSLQALANNAGKDIDLFRTSVENWYDDHMSRVSGWYKRYVAKITIVIGAILILLLNINTLTIGRTLYSNSVVRTAVSSVAAKTTSCPADESKQTCLADLQAQLSAATQAGLPIGWGTVADCAAPNIHCNWLDQRGIFSRHGGSPWQFVLVLAGFLMTIIALTPGARFWFDLLGRLGSLRSTGPKPAS
jgi:nucleoid-associated protein YgaU